MQNKDGKLYVSNKLNPLHRVNITSKNKTWIQKKKKSSNSNFLKFFSNITFLKGEHYGDFLGNFTLPKLKDCIVCEVLCDNFLIFSHYIIILKFNIHIFNPPYTSFRFYVCIEFWYLMFIFIFNFN